jgi:2-keto-4-pentenoate hydratase/2-oxohepta-3-ene-1,7-dioic acid hydratase in catechol pathway
MRIGTLNNRYHALAANRALDIAEASQGRFAADGFEIFERFDELAGWLATVPDTAYTSFDSGALGPPVPMPRQVFAIGLNYRDHAAESGLAEPDEPLVFTKYPTSITGPSATVALPSEHVDWEAELVAVIGARAENVKAADAWPFVAGLTVGQDLSERRVQLAGPAPQFSLGKSFPGFGPIGPAIVTLDEIADVDNLEVSCRLDDEVLQKGRTSDLIFSIPQLLEHISAICPMLPGDLIFTGTPAGVGGARTPNRFLTPGSVLITAIEGIGELRNRLV